MVEGWRWKVLGADATKTAATVGKSGPSMHFRYSKSTKDRFSVFMHMEKLGVAFIHLLQVSKYGWLAKRSDELCKVYQIHHHVREKSLQTRLSPILKGGN